MDKSIVVIPTYNEKENIEDIISAVFNLEVPFHVLIVDDNSPDGTAEIVKRMQEDLFYKDRLHLEERQGKLGLGTAYIHGFNWAMDHNFNIIFEMDADFSHNPRDLVELYKAIVEENYDMSIGSRYVTGVNVVNWPIGRVLMSIFASSYVRFVTGMPIHDTTAGFVAYRREVLETIDLSKIKFIGYAFQIEMKFRTWKGGFEIKEVPIIFTDRTRGESKMSGKIFNEAFFGVLQMKMGSWFTKYPKKSNSK